MFVGSDKNTALASRWAIEALRSGVPNRYAVQELESNQLDAERQFRAILDRVTSGGVNESEYHGMMVSGDFGSGKSHLLVHLEQIALQDNFVTSRIVISKETPLYDLGKVFSAAMECGKLPDRKGRFVEELCATLRPGWEDYLGFRSAVGQAGHKGLLSMIYPASCAVHERGEMREEIEEFWSGGKITVPNLRRGLRSIGMAKEYKFSAPRQSDLPMQRLRFVAELIRGAGYRGWVVLLDEIELIGHYSILQRGRSYAEIARWMGHASVGNRPFGLIAVGAVTDGFESEVISPNGRKQDRDKIGPRLRSHPRYMSIADRAEAGMAILERDYILLKEPDEMDVANTLEKLRNIYLRAYGTRPPPATPITAGAGFQRQIRHKVRAAINEWDLRRFYPDRAPQTEVDQFVHNYAEDATLERPASDDAQ